MTPATRSMTPRRTGPGQGAPAASPEVDHATRRHDAVASAGDPQHARLFGGTGFGPAEARPAGEVGRRPTSMVRR